MTQSKLIHRHRAQDSHRRLEAVLSKRPDATSKAQKQKMKICLLLLAGTVLLSGCGNTRAYWTKPDIDQDRYNADWDECQKQKSPDECMRAKGYVEVKRPVP